MSSAPTVSNSLTLQSFNTPLTVTTTALPSPTPAGTAIVSVLSVVVRPHNKAGFQGKGPLHVTAPYTPGNSAVARIISVGPDAVALKPGQLVWVNGHLCARDDPIGTQVLLGMSDLTGQERPAKLFSAWEGLWRDVGVVPVEQCYPLDEARLVKQMGYSFSDLEYLERLSVAYGGVGASGARAGETVVVAPATGHYSGAAAELAAQVGCRVIALTRSKAKLEPLAKRHSRIMIVEVTGDAQKDVAAIKALCPPNSQGPDAYIDISPGEATGNPHHLNIGLESLRPGGRAVLLGSMFNVSINYVSIMGRGISIKGQFMYSRDQLETLIKMIEAGVVKLGKEAGHEVVDGGFKLDEWEKAIDAAEKATFWGQQVLLLPNEK